MINAQELSIKLYTIPELAIRVNIGTGTVYKYIYQGWQTYRCEDRT